MKLVREIVRELNISLINQSITNNAIISKITNKAKFY